LTDETSKSLCLDKNGIIDFREPQFWGDFFEQVLGVDRNDVLTEMEARLSKFFNIDYDIKDPFVANVLYHAKLKDLCGHDELEFSEIYPPTSI